jgi:hypothetical protein
MKNRPEKSPRASSHHEKETNRLHKDKEKWEMWIDVVLRTCTRPSVVGSA